MKLFNFKKKTDNQDFYDLNIALINKLADIEQLKDQIITVNNQTSILINERNNELNEFSETKEVFLNEINKQAKDLSYQLAEIQNQRSRLNIIHRQQLDNINTKINEIQENEKILLENQKNFDEDEYENLKSNYEKNLIELVKEKEVLVNNYDVNIARISSDFEVKNSEYEAKVEELKIALEKQNETLLKDEVVLKAEIASNISKYQEIIEKLNQEKVDEISNLNATNLAEIELLKEKYTSLNKHYIDLKKIADALVLQYEQRKIEFKDELAEIKKEFEENVSQTNKALLDKQALVDEANNELYNTTIEFEESYRESYNSLLAYANHIKNDIAKKNFQNDREKFVVDEKFTQYYNEYVSELESSYNQHKDELDRALSLLKKQYHLEKEKLEQEKARLENNLYEKQNLFDEKVNLLKNAKEDLEDSLNKLSFKLEANKQKHEIELKDIKLKYEKDIEEQKSKYHQEYQKRADFFKKDIDDINDAIAKQDAEIKLLESEVSSLNFKNESQIQTNALEKEKLITEMDGEISNYNTELSLLTEQLNKINLDIEEKKNLKESELLKISQEKEELSNNFLAEIAAIKAKHETDINELKLNQETKIQELEKKHEADLKEIEDAYNLQVKEIETKRNESFELLEQEKNKLTLAIETFDDDTSSFVLQQELLLKDIKDIEESFKQEQLYFESDYEVISQTHRENLENLHKNHLEALDTLSISFEEQKLLKLEEMIKYLQEKREVKAEILKLENNLKQIAYSYDQEVNEILSNKQAEIELLKVNKRIKEEKYASLKNELDYQEELLKEDIKIERNKVNDVITEMNALKDQLFLEHKKRFNEQMHYFEEDLKHKQAMLLESANLKKLEYETIINAKNDELNNFKANYHALLDKLSGKRANLASDYNLKVKDLVIENQKVNSRLEELMNSLNIIREERANDLENLKLENQRKVEEVKLKNNAVIEELRSKYQQALALKNQEVSNLKGNIEELLNQKQELTLKIKDQENLNEEEILKLRVKYANDISFLKTTIVNITSDSEHLKKMHSERVYDFKKELMSLACEYDDTIKTKPNSLTMEFSSLQESLRLKTKHYNQELIKLDEIFNESLALLKQKTSEKLQEISAALNEVENKKEDVMAFYKEELLSLQAHYQDLASQENAKLKKGKMDLVLLQKKIDGINREYALDQEKLLNENAVDIEKLKNEKEQVMTSLDISSSNNLKEVDTNLQYLLKKESDVNIDIVSLKERYNQMDATVYETREKLHADYLSNISNLIKIFDEEYERQGEKIKLLEEYSEKVDNLFRH